MSRHVGSLSQSLYSYGSIPDDPGSPAAEQTSECDERSAANSSKGVGHNNGEPCIVRNNEVETTMEPPEALPNASDPSFLGKQRVTRLIPWRA